MAQFIINYEPADGPRIAKALCNANGIEPPFSEANARLGLLKYIEEITVRDQRANQVITPPKIT